MFFSSDIKVAVTGAAVETVAGATVTVKDDEKYVGSEIKVTVLDTENDLVATKVLTVVDEANELVFDINAVPVDKTEKITVQLVDGNGKAVSLANSADVAPTADVIVLSKAAGSDVTLGTPSAVNVNKGLFTFTFAADKVGTYEVQAVLQVKEGNAWRYYTGIGEIKVGGVGMDKVVVMSIGSDQIIINDKVAKMACEAVIKDGRTMVPFRAGLEALGAKVDYDQATQSVIAELDGTKVVMTLGEKVYTVNGVAKTADVAPYLNVAASTTMVPASFVANEFGINVSYTTNPDGTVADVIFAN